MPPFLHSTSCVLVAALIAVPGVVSAQIATFDDAAAGCVAGSVQDRAVSVGYDALNWSNFFVADGAAERASNTAGDGYAIGTVSSSCIAYNAYGGVASISSATGAPFTFNGGYFTAAYRDAMQLHIEGYRLGATMFTQDLVLRQTHPQLLDVRWIGVDALGFFPEVNAASYQFVADDLRFNDAGDPRVAVTTPEPATLALFACGVAAVLGIAGAQRMRRPTR